MKIDRLFGILTQLLNRDKITVKEFAKMYEVSERTIYRDVETLAKSGVPIYGISGANGGMKIMQNFSLDKTLLNHEEKQALLFAVESIKLSNVSKYDELLVKLSGLFKIKVNDWLDIDLSTWDYKDKLMFNIIKNSILKSKIVKFNYYNRNSEKSIRKIEPYKLMYKSNTWYVIGYCIKTEDYRIFKLNRMKSIECTEEIFVKRTEYDPDYVQTSNSHQSTTTIIAKIDKSFAYRVYDEFHENQIKTDEQGNFIVEINFPEDNWLYGYLLSFGEKLKVISPDRISNIIYEKLQKMMINYQNHDIE